MSQSYVQLPLFGDPPTGRRKPRPVKTCPTCDLVFTCYPCEAKRKRFCSTTCMREHWSRWHERTERQCTRCHETLPVSAFGRDASRVDGFSATCRECERAECRKWRKANPERVREYSRCRLRDPEKSRVKDRLCYQRNQAVNRAKRREHYRRNPDLYHAAHARRKARVRSATVCDLTAAQWRDIKAQFAHRCVYCDADDVKLTMDHVIPIVKGGGHTASNIVPACALCNGRKHARLPTPDECAKIARYRGEPKSGEIAFDDFLAWIAGDAR